MISLLRKGCLAAVALGMAGVIELKIAAASPQDLDCVLTDIETKSVTTKFDSQVGAEKRRIAVSFDDEAGTLAVQIDGASTALQNVSISQTSMNGAAKDFSLGIDRSSWRIVFQTYKPAERRNEFGSCTLRSPQSAGASPQ